MKYLIFVVSLSLTINAFGQDRLQITPERSARWQQLSQDMTYIDLYTLMEEMSKLKKSPWDEPEKQILLKMTETMTRLQQDLLNDRPVILPEYMAGPFTEKNCQDYDSILYEMVSWQDDPRFIEFQSTFWGQGISARGLARIGEPAFETVIASFDRDPFFVESIQTLENMMEDKDSFLHKDHAKRAQAQQALIKALHFKGKTAQLGAAYALRYFPSHETIVLLETISLNDPWMEVNGRFPLRSRAREALKFMRAQGN